MKSAFIKGIIDEILVLEIKRRFRMNNSINRSINRIWEWDIILKYEIKLNGLYKRNIFDIRCE